MEKLSDVNGDWILFIYNFHLCYCLLLCLHIYWCSFILFTIELLLQFFTFTASSQELAR